ncbi:MAG: asparagine synthase [Methanomassiliicoccaceae archaeon]|jgi:asparagine synthase (glutamine-hydrolysing)|nr:asparagine synthase [Methanomassiliicoccaceae archaeon]
MTLIVNVANEQLVAELTSALEASIKETVLGKKAAIAFSGGLDSGIVTVLCKKYADVTLYTVGVKDAYDVKASEEMAKILGSRWRHLEISEGTLEEALPEMIRITGTVNPITLSFEVPLYYVLKYSEEDTVLGGQGADELFAGYSKYIGLSRETLADAVRDDMAQLLNVTLMHERAVARHFDKTAAYPYLDERVVSFVNRIGMSGVQEGEVRKPLLRDVARSLGHPELAEKPKKSAQYGSGTMVAMRSMAKKRNMTVREMILRMKDDLK